MPVTISQDFRKSSIDLISCHTPLVLKAYTDVLSSDPDDSNIVATIEGQTPADNTNRYTFSMAYTGSTFAIGGGYYRFYYTLDITDIIRKICNSPRLEREGTVDFYTPSRLATKIEIICYDKGGDDASLINTYMHGFNQVHDPDGACLVDFASKGAVIPIAPGIPMLFHAWQPSAGAAGDWITYHT